MNHIEKDELKTALKAGFKMSDLFDFSEGQGCLIFKEDGFLLGKKIIYIPDVFLNEIPLDSPIANDTEIIELLDECYSGDDFIELCDGNVEMAERLFWYCDWQHPSSALPEIEDEEA